MTHGIHGKSDAAGNAMVAPPTAVRLGAKEIDADLPAPTNGRSPEYEFVMLLRVGLCIKPPEVECAEATGNRQEGGVGLSSHKSVVDGKNHEGVTVAGKSLLFPAQASVRDLLPDGSIGPREIAGSQEAERDLVITGRYAAKDTGLIPRFLQPSPKRHGSRLVVASVQEL
jgi:hypothetical protein